MNLRNNNATTSKLSTLSGTELRQVLGIDSDRRDDEPMGYIHHGFQETAIGLIDKFIAAAYRGLDDDDPFRSIRSRVKDLDDAIAVARELITYETYSVIEVDFQIPDDYNGLDALVEMARIEFAHNIFGDSADEDELAACFGDRA